MWDAMSVQQVAMGADITFDALGGPLASALLAKMRAGAVFVGYGLLTGRPVTTAVNVRASFERFHLRDALRTMTARKFRAYFDALWPLLLETNLPKACVWPAREWRRAIHATTEPGSSKQILDVASLGSGLA
jgi:NADPH:quinone reductase-like Zn-dependent oxidoreductase